MGSPDSAVVVVEGVSAHGSGRTLRALDLHVRAGETVALVGDDQVLLTLAIRVIAGLVLPTDGRVTLLGVDVARADRDELLALRRRVGYVSVAGGLLSNMTVRGNVEVAMRYHRVATPAEIRERAEHWLHEAGLMPVADTLASTVPAELQKCAAYVRALAIEPTVLLSEDPAAFLHPEGRTAIERLHRRMRETGMTVIIADDDVDLARRLVDRPVRIEGEGIVSGGFSGPVARPGATVPAPGRS